MGPEWIVVIAVALVLFGGTQSPKLARSLGQGHPFEWIPGQGYSSGETSPLYAAVLALGWVLGFRGRALGIWAAVVAVLGVASLLRPPARPKSCLGFMGVVTSRSVSSVYPEQASAPPFSCRSAP